MKKHATVTKASPDRELEQALVSAAHLYRTEHERLRRTPRGSGFDRRWTRVADRARLARSLFLALLDDATRAAPLIAR